MTSIGRVEQIPLTHIKLATENFDKKNFIAAGGFGMVYQGHSEQYGTIAVKRLIMYPGIVDYGQDQFQMEIQLLSAYKHENLVSLVGFCDQDGGKLLVYKYESNGSLDKHLQREDLNWIQRLQICLDAAKGLKYLHHDVGSQDTVVHRDVKTSNILLDENMKAKISDFGLSKISPTNVSSSFLFSNPCGTQGYMDPEYVTYGALSQKTDVYSFGIVLFEVLCGRPARVGEYKDRRQFLCILAPYHFRKHTLHEIIYSNLRDQLYPNSLRTFSTIAYRCLTKYIRDRPSMIQIVKQLRKALDEQLAAASGRPGIALRQGPSTFMDYMTQSGLMASSSSTFHSTLPSSSSQSWKHDVFLSFRGTDTRNNFVDHLYSALVQQGIGTYKDDVTLPRGETIDIALLTAIEKSQIAVIVFSENYADSKWCLQELAHIMKCKDERGLIIIPIFYHISPYELRHQKGKYGEALAKHVAHFDIKNQHGEYGKAITKSDVNKVESWRKALRDAAELAGLVANGPETFFIKRVVDTIVQKLLPSLLSTIGIKTRLEKIKSQIQVGFGGVHMVGIYGNWGSGKSTLASALYDKLHHEFEGCCFLKSVGRKSRKHGSQGLQRLQEKILSKVLNLRKSVVLGSIGEGISMMKSTLFETSALIVLDDVDHLIQLKMLAGSKDWFGEGSRIIITTRNRSLLEAHKVGIMYDMGMLNEEEALQLFSMHAFGANNRLVKGYGELSQKMVSKFVGHPSAIIRLGSILRGKDMSEWMRTLARLEDTTVDEVLELFRTGYDGVESYINYWLGFSDASVDKED
ncbi:hypothetical protein OSB04_018715 [Centaurea solstitialis]|uniref:non-specific serine/threonine protein kinase n=1 Tax=Centaurea solstitialis TaxID=347529 RepID=A0AA38T5B7_9ASTR|nr:hypothetical protein OSB04_018715 [Centaurea solstitialis]